MNQTILARLLGRMFRAPDAGTGDAAAAAAAAAAANAVKPEEARTFVADFVEPDALKAMKDEDVVKAHSKYKGAVDKITKTSSEKAKVEAIEKAKNLKLELPKDSKLHATDADAVLAYAREHGLSEEHAKAVLNHRNDAVAKHEARQKANTEAKAAEWVKTVSEDPDLGGAKLVETQRQAQLAIDKFMPQPLRDMLRETKLGDHPEVVRFLRNVGATLKEDSPPNLGGGQGGGKKSAEDVLYGAPTT